MKNIFLISINYSKSNGLLGVCWNSICQLRGGDDYGKIAHSDISDPLAISKNSKNIDEILDNGQISETYTPS
jgi:hypothetical protein